jgi:putative sterol carrier protein
MAELTLDQLKAILTLSIEKINKEDLTVKEKKYTLKVLHYLKDVDFYFMLIIQENVLSIDFCKRDDSDVILEMDLDVFHGIQMGKIDAFFSGMTGTFRLVKGNPLQLIILQQFPIGRVYQNAAAVILGNSVKAV